MSLEHFQIALTETAPDAAIGLLLPIPPRTHFQRLVALKLIEAERVTILSEPRLGQQALLLQPNISDHTLAEFQLDLQSGAAVTEHFSHTVTSSLSQSSDVFACHERIFGGQLRLDPQLCLHEICAYLAEQFDYIHHDDELNRGELCCNHLRGDCLDINTALMKLLALNGMDSAYYIGLFFEQDSDADVDDWHCWVSTRIEQPQDWDIAHHIKRRLGQIQPALNPVPGTRFALSSGRDLVFRLDDHDWTISHLGAPTWLLADGAYRQARFSARYLIQEQVNA